MPKKCNHTTQKGTRCTFNAVADGKCKRHAGLAKKTGRKTKLTPEVEQRIIKAIQSGATFEDAARFAGIAPSTFYKYRELGEADIEAGKTTEFSEFVESVTRAIASANVNASLHITRAMSSDWRAAAWFLERRDPANWSIKHRVEHSGAVGVTGTQPEELIPDDDEFHAQVAQILDEAEAIRRD